jgi:lantibiotic modifying enzyme
MWHAAHLLPTGLATRTIDDIYHTIRKNNAPLSGIGFLNGHLGISLFYYLYSLHVSQKSVFAESAACFESGLNMLHTNPQINYPLHCTELCAVSQQLADAGVLSLDPNRLLGKWDKILLANMRTALAQMNVGGFATGATGYGLYFLSRARYNPDRFAPVIRELTDSLDQYAISSQQACHWCPDQRVALTLWNGQAAVILFLACAADYGFIDKKRFYTMIGKAVNFLSFQLKHQPFSNLLSVHLGDLGTGYALLRAGQTFENEHWQASALEILGKRAGTYLANGASTEPAGILTGVAGAAIAFDKVFSLTGNQLFSAAADLSYTAILSSLQDQPTGHISKSSRCDLCFGTGLSGIGSSLIKMLHRENIRCGHHLWLI